MECLFRKFFHIKCPACGLTRALIQITKFNFIKAFNYNILSIPLLLLIFYLSFNLIKCIIKKDFTFFKNFKDFIIKHYLIIFIILIINMIINNIRPI